MYSTENGSPICGSKGRANDNLFQEDLSYSCASWDFNPEYSLEGLILKLKLQYFGHLK